MEAGETVLLSETISLYPGKVKQNISVTNIRVIMRNPEHSEKEVQEIVHLKDVIGCHVLQEKKRPSTAYLCIFSYPLKKKRFGSGIIRQRVTRTLAMNVGGTFHENLMLAETWKITIKRLIGGEIINSKQDLDNGSLTTRNLLVLVNPFSGRKKAMMMYKEKVKPMFTEAEIKHTVMTTEYPGHAKEMAKELKIKDWDGIVTVSGDGLIHEVINGLMDREDWEEAIKIPIGVVPGGSGNALAAAVVYASTGQSLSANLELDAVFEVVKGRIRNMSLVAAETESGQRFYSFLNFAWGFIADVDIESERFRKLGPVRFTIGCALRVANMRLYQGRISYLPVANGKAFSFGQEQSYQTLSAEGLEDSEQQQLPTDVAICEDLNHTSTEGLVGGSHAPNTRNNHENCVEASVHKEISEHTGRVSPSTEQKIPNTASSKSANKPQSENLAAGDSVTESPASPSCNLVDAHHGGVKIPSNGFSNESSVDENQQVRDTQIEPLNQKPKDKSNLLENCSETSSVSMVSKGNLDHKTPISWKDSAVLYHLRASLDSDPPRDWVVIESEFVWVTSVYLSHIGNEMMGVPSAGLDDDVMYIYLLRHGISKPKMVNVLMGFETGTHIERGGEFSSVIPCSAVRLEPFTFITGHMTVDGELIPHCSIQASVTPHKIPIMASVAKE